jgi:hypothetical protein
LHSGNAYYSSNEVGVNPEVPALPINGYGRDLSVRGVLPYIAGLGQLPVRELPVNWRESKDAANIFAETGSGNEGLAAYPVPSVIMGWTISFGEHP